MDPNLVKDSGADADLEVNYERDKNEHQDEARQQKKWATRASNQGALRHPCLPLRRDVMRDPGHPYQQLRRSPLRLKQAAPLHKQDKESNNGESRKEPNHATVPPAMVAEEPGAIRGDARSYLEQLLRGRHPAPIRRAQSLVGEESACLTEGLAIDAFMNNVRNLERVAIEVHAVCLRNVHEGRSQDELLARAWGLPETFPELQEECCELTARLTTPSPILAEAPVRLARSIGALNSAIVIMLEPPDGTIHRPPGAGEELLPPKATPAA